MIYKGLSLLPLVILISACTSDPVVTKPETPSEISRPIIPKQSTPTTKPTSTYTGKKTKQVGHYSAPSLSGDYSGSTSANNFIRKFSRQHGFSESYLKGVLSKAKHLNSVVKLERPPSKVKKKFTPSRGSWSRYRKKFIKNSHINNGVKFWHKNSRTLERASRKYRVDPEYIVAIIGVET